MLFPTSSTPVFNLCNSKHAKIGQLHLDICRCPAVPRDSRGAAEGDEDTCWYRGCRWRVSHSPPAPPRSPLRKAEPVSTPALVSRPSSCDKLLLLSPDPRAAGQEPQELTHIPVLPWSGISWTQLEISAWQPFQVLGVMSTRGKKAARNPPQGHETRNSYHEEVEGFQQSLHKADGEWRALGVKFWTEQSRRRETNM